MKEVLGLFFLFLFLLGEGKNGFGGFVYIVDVCFGKVFIVSFVCRIVYMVYILLLLGFFGF